MADANKPVLSESTSHNDGRAGHAISVQLARATSSQLLGAEATQNPWADRIPRLTPQLPKLTVLLRGCPGFQGMRLGSTGMAREDTHIVLRTGGVEDPIVDHPGQPADYVHNDGTVWTWQARRWRPVGGDRDGERIAGRVVLRLYDLVTPTTDGA